MATTEKFRYSPPDSVFPLENPFQTPPARSIRSVRSRAGSFVVPAQSNSHVKQRKFKSARLIGEYEKPWTQKHEPRKAWDKIFFFGFMGIGMAIGAVICYFGWIGVPHDNYCLIFEDNFANGIDSNNWNREIQIGGFGTGSFDWTTDDDKNAYTDGQGLHIVPTFTVDTTAITEDQIQNGYTLNLTTDGTCTSTSVVSKDDCSTKSNSTSGTIINPIRSARLNTKGRHSITYGKVEVIAKLPKGAWLWPAIWMMPESDTYGPWPASGEIDVMESKGNDGDDYQGGRDEASATIHWGPVQALDLFYKTTGKRVLRRTDFSNDFHTFGLEWTANYLYTYVDTRLAQSLYIGFGSKRGNMWKRGDFANLFVNGSAEPDPWSQTGRYNTPFDQPFYLILNVAVGGTNGYFKDGLGHKPWIDKSPTAMRDFYASRHVWEPTWGKGADRGMTVKSVKIWSEGKCTAK